MRSTSRTENAANYGIYWAIGGWDHAQGEVVAGGVRLYPRPARGYASLRFCKLLMAGMREPGPLAELERRHGPGVLVILDRQGHRVEPWTEASRLTEEPETRLLTGVLTSAA